MRNKPQAEFHIDADLVRRLLRQQLPDLADLPIVEVAAGWDNVMFRLGDSLSVRLPRRAVAAPLALNEQRWLPMLRDRLPVPIPAPVRVGEPSEEFPWPWSVCPWFEGHVLGSAMPSDRARLALSLGEFLSDLHRPSPPEAPENPFRGVPLQHRDQTFRSSLERISEMVDPLWALDVWDQALEVPEWSGPPVWVHGDLHPLNLVVDRDELVAVIDFGDLTGGDPSCDLAIAWMIFDGANRARFRIHAGNLDDPVDDDTWSRGYGWALNFAVIYLANSLDVPELELIGRRTIHTLMASHPDP